MSWPAELAAAKRELSNLFKSAIAQLFVYTLTAKASAIGDKDSIESSDDAKAPGAPSTEPKPQRSVARIQPFGFNGVPPKGIRSLTLQLGKSNLLFMGIAPTKAYGPQDLGSGDASLYSSGAAQVRATGDDVIVNNGTAKVGRVGDKLSAAAALASWASVVETAINALAPGTFFPGTNSFATPGTGAGAAGNLGTINSGAPHFKG